MGPDDPTPPEENKPEVVTSQASELPSVVEDSFPWWIVIVVVIIIILIAAIILFFLLSQKNSKKDETKG